MNSHKGKVFSQSDVITHTIDDKIIEIKYSRSDFEEIYYRNGDDKTFLNSHLKNERNTFIVVSFGFILTLIYCLSFNENYSILIFTGLLLCFVFFDWYQKASHWIKWKNDIKLYLDNLDKIRKTKIVLSKYAFSVVQDKKETIEKWTEFKRAEIEDNFISLTSNTTTYLIPKKSMTTEEFEFLSAMFAERINNEL
jgi:hypothetical protein